MAKVVGDIAVEVSADISPLQRGLSQGGQSLDSFGDRAAKMGARVAKVGGIVAAGVGAAAAGAYKLASSAAEAGAEIEMLARIAGTSPEKFQRFAYAARTVGVEQDKLADILKDVQDRIGDFIETGGGPMADFFENIAPKVGVTAEQFAKLGGPEALQLYVKSLQDAGLTQNQMTFYLEAMASDATNLIPLLQDNSAELNRLGQEAQDAGRVMSNDAVAGSADLKRELEDLTGSIRTQFTEAILENKDEIRALVDDIENIWIPALFAVAEAVTTVISALGDAVDAYKQLRDLIRDGDLQNFDGSGVMGPTGGLADAGGGDGHLSSGERDPVAGAGQTGPNDQALRDFYGLGDGGQGAGAMNFLGEGGPVEEAEVARNERLLEILRNYGDQRFELLSEIGETELGMQRDFAEKSAEIEELSKRQKLALVGGAFGDLASLMTTENEKLFRIGKAAAIAEATVSGYRAAVDAWEKGMAVGGPPVAAAFTAASLARTGALISQISSQSLSGGSASGVGGGGGGAAAAAAPQAPLDVRLSGLGANDLLTGADVGALLDRLSDEAGDRGLRLTVAR